MKNPVGGLLRCSTGKQDDSIEQQKKEVKKWAAENGREVVEWIEEEDVSGLRTEKRSKFQNLIQRAERGELPFQELLVYDRSRLSRASVLEANYYEYLLLKKGIKITDISDPTSDPDTIGGVLTRTIKQQSAHDFSIKLAKDVFRGATAHTRKGRFVGGNPPYGYERLLVDSDNKPVLNSSGKPTILKRGQQKVQKDQHVIPIPGPAEHVAIVKKIFQLFTVENRTERDIANHLNEKGTLSPSGKEWCPSTVGHMLHDSCYIGKLIYNKRARTTGHGYHKPRSEWVESEILHEAIVDSGTWQKAQDRGCGELLRHGNGRAQNSPYLFSGGLFKCTECGGNYVGVQKKNKNKIYNQYQCVNYNHKGRKGCPVYFGVSRDQTEDEIAGYVMEHYLKPEQWKQMIQPLFTEAIKSLQSDSGPRTNAINSRLIKLNGEIDNMKRAIKDGCPASEFVDDFQRAFREKTALENEKVRFQQVGGGVPDFKQEVSSFLDKLADFKPIFDTATPGAKKVWMRNFIQKMEGNPKTKEIKVYLYKFPTQVLSTFETAGAGGGS